MDLYVGAPLTAGGDTPLPRDGFLVRMVLQHEYQHNETISPAPETMVRVAGGAGVEAPKHTFRNRDNPLRRPIFAGLRGARDA